MALLGGPLAHLLGPTFLALKNVGVTFGSLVGWTLLGSQKCWDDFRPFGWAQHFWSLRTVGLTFSSFVGSTFYGSQKCWSDFRLFCWAQQFRALKNVGPTKEPKATPNIFESQNVGPNRWAKGPPNERAIIGPNNLGPTKGPKVTPTVLEAQKCRSNKWAKSYSDRRANSSSNTNNFKLSEPKIVGPNTFGQQKRKGASRCHGVLSIWTSKIEILVFDFVILSTGRQPRLHFLANLCDKYMKTTIDCHFKLTFV